MHAQVRSRRFHFKTFHPKQGVNTTRMQVVVGATGDEREGEGFSGDDCEKGKKGSGFSKKQKTKKQEIAIDVALNFQKLYLSDKQEIGRSSTDKKCEKNRSGGGGN